MKVIRFILKSTLVLSIISFCIFAVAPALRVTSEAGANDAETCVGIFVAVAVISPICLLSLILLKLFGKDKK